VKHIPSHADALHRTQDQAGNSCADRVASFYRLEASSSSSSTLNQLPLHLGEEWMYVRHNNTIISSDIRASLRVRMNSCAFEWWNEQSKHNAFATPDVRTLCQQIMKEGDRKRVRCVLSLLTDSFQYYSARTDRMDGFGEFQCNACRAGVIANVKHVMSCSERKNARTLACAAIRAELNSLPKVRDWMRMNVVPTASLQHLMCCVFNVSRPVDSNDRACLRLIIGAVSDKEAAAAMKRMQNTNRESWEPVMSNIRLILFDHVYSIWLELRV
jgi:hypothetical protein